MTPEEIARYKRRFAREQAKADAAALANGGALLAQRRMIALKKTAIILSSKPLESLTPKARKKLAELQKMGLLLSSKNELVDTTKLKCKI